MKVLVVGGAGYIGGAVTDALLHKSIPFVVYDALLYENHYLKPVEFVKGDIRDTEKLKSLLPQFTHVVWLAALVGDGACQKDPAITEDINQHSVEWLANNFNGRIIFTSTCSVYGQHDDLLDENSEVKPLSVYAQTKLDAEKFLTKENALIFRLGTAFGVSDTYSRPRMDLALNYMTARAITTGKITVNGGAQWRPMIHVRDIAHAIVENLDRPVRGIYNLAAVNTQIKDLGQTIADLTGCEVEFTDEQFQDKRNYHVSNDKALRDGVINLNTARTMSDGIREISNLVKDGRMRYNENTLYSNERHIEYLIKNGQLTKFDQHWLGDRRAR